MTPMAASLLRECEDAEALGYFQMTLSIQRVRNMAKALEAVGVLLAEARERGGSLSDGEKLGCEALALAAAAEGRDVKQARGVARQSGPDRGNAQ